MKASGGLFNWFSKSKKIASKDFSVIIHRFEDEIVENAKTLFDKFSMVRAKYKMTIEKPSKSAWTSLMLSKMEKIGGSEFSMWISEYVPAYRLQIDADRLTGLKFDGWKRSTGNFWEVFLTHSQMVICCFFFLPFPIWSTFNRGKSFIFCYVCDIQTIIF